MRAIHSSKRIGSLRELALSNASRSEPLIALGWVGSAGPAGDDCLRPDDRLNQLICPTPVGPPGAMPARPVDQQCQVAMVIYRRSRRRLDRRRSHQVRRGRSFQDWRLMSTDDGKPQRRRDRRPAGVAHADGDAVDRGEQGPLQCRVGGRAADLGLIPHRSRDRRTPSRSCREVRLPYLTPERSPESRSFCKSGPCPLLNPGQNAPSRNNAGAVGRPRHRAQLISFVQCLYRSDRSTLTPS
jgi:hypothetical protein